MSNISLFRGGTPNFRPAFCCGDYPEFLPPFTARHMPGTPPFDSHADGAHAYGYLNLTYPLCPNLMESSVHRWMHHALRKIKAVDDIIQLIWVPDFSFIDSLCITVPHYDACVDGVVVQPVAQRARWNFDEEKWDFEDNTEFDSDISTYANVTTLPLGTPGDSDSSYLVARFPTVGSTLPATFGHSILKYDDDGKPTGGFDDYYGNVVLGLKIVEGDTEKLKTLWKSHFELYYTAKSFHFDCAGFTG